MASSDCDKLNTNGMNYANRLIEIKGCAFHPVWMRLLSKIIENLRGRGGSTDATREDKIQGYLNCCKLIINFWV